MDVPNMTPAEFMNQSPEELFLFLTHSIYDARKKGRLDDIGTLLSVFGPDARRALLIGSAALLCMDRDTAYGQAMREAIGKTLYDHFRGGIEK